MALIDDPKVQALVDKVMEKANKDAAKAVKAETKRVMALVNATLQTVIASVTNTGDKATAKLLKGLQKDIATTVKSAE